MLGTILLNPRIMEYDFAPITGFVVLLVWRVFAWRNSLGRTIREMLIFFVLINTYSSMQWRPTAGIVSTLIFLASAWTLWRQAGLFLSDETLAAYGEVVWSWRRDPGVKLAGVSRRRRWQEGPLTGESTK